jgi:hypothetical protein
MNSLRIFNTTIMKKLMLIIICITLIGNFLFAITPPEAVKKAFEKKFPTASSIAWSKENAKEWEAEFTFEGNKISTNFGEDGTWLETEQEIKASDLPKAVLDAIKLKYQGWTISEADKTETPKLGTIFEVDLKKGTEKKSAAFKTDGTSVAE